MKFRTLDTDSCFHVHSMKKHTYFVLCVDDLLQATSDTDYNGTFKRIVVKKFKIKLTTVVEMYMEVGLRRLQDRSLWICHHQKIEELAKVCKDTGYSGWQVVAMNPSTDAENTFSSPFTPVRLY